MFKNFITKYNVYLYLLFIIILLLLFVNYYILPKTLNLNNALNLNIRVINKYLEKKNILDGPKYIFNITPKENFKSILERLKHDKILNLLDYYVLNLYAKVTGLDRHIKAGEYVISNNSTAINLLKQFTKGQVVLHRFTIVEGLRYEQIMEQLQNHPAIMHTLTSYTCKEVLNNIGKNVEENITECEGLFMPDTYFFARDTKDIIILQNAYDSMNSRLSNLWNKSVNDYSTIQLVLKSKYEALIIASIIEKETSLVKEMNKISGVYHKRLQHGIPLQADPTVIYGLKIFDRKITRADLKIPSKYNTYLNKGLPPSPIATPSLAAIIAALNPVIEGYLYFVADGSGGHVFSNSLLEHNQAIEMIRNNKIQATKVELE